MYTKILIAGASSFIASQSLAGLNLDNSKIFLVSREAINSKYEFEGSLIKSLKINDFRDKNVFETLENFLQLNSDDRLLIINFIGSFGSIESLDMLNLEKFSSEVEENLIPFMVLSKLIAVCKEGLFLSFAGAGVGGELTSSATWIFGRARPFYSTRRRCGPGMDLDQSNKMI